MPLRIILIIMLSVIGIVNELHADQAGFEYREKKGLLVFEGFQQWVDLRYQFNDHYTNSGAGSSTSHSLQELYNVSLNTALLDPNIFESSLNGIIGFDQDKFTGGGASSFSNQAQYQYIFNGAALKKSPNPITVKSSRQISNVSSQYTPTYTTDTTNNEVNVAIRNDILSSNFNFARNTLDTSGAGFNSSTAGESFSYTAVHKYKTISDTTLSGSLSDQSSSIGDSRANRFSLTNSLGWGAGRAYTLLSSVQLLDAIYSGVPEFDLTYSETSRVLLGPALSLEANYSLTKTRTNDLLGQNTQTSQNQVDVALRHSLFQSLETALIGKASTNDLLGGKETKYSGAVKLNYRKLLPDECRMTAAISDEYEVDDRHVVSSVTTVQNKLFPGVHQGDTITLPLSGAMLQTVISVKSTLPAFTYSEGTDYTVNYALGTIFIPLGSRIDNPTSSNGTDLTISYTFFMDPSLKYTSNSFTGNMSVALFNGVYVIGASYNEQQYSHIVSLTSSGLRNSRAIQMFLSSSHESFGYRVTVTDAELGDLHSDNVEGSGQYFWENMTLTALERYAVYGASQSGPGYRENTSQGTLTYNRLLASAVNFVAAANVADVRSSVRKTNDYASLRTAVKIPLNKLTFTMTAQTGWVFSGSTVTRDDSINITISRYF